MADFYSDLFVTWNKNPPEQVSFRDHGGGVKATSFDFTGQIAQGDIVNLTRLPVGAKVVGGVIVVQTAFAASGATATIRTETNATAFGTAIDITATTPRLVDRAAQGLAYVAGSSSETAQWERVYLVSTATGTTPAAGRIRGVILYTG